MVTTIRKKQCAACPWKKSTRPERDIAGYHREQHESIARTIAEPGRVTFGPTRAMACHESREGADHPCVGWLVHQLGPGNNIGLRLMARDGRFEGLKIVGPQHARFEDTLPEREDPG